mgnify:CR=1 FL=1
MGLQEDELISKWLIEEGFNVRKLETQPHFRIAWGLDVFTQPPLHVNLKVFRPEGREDRYVLLLGVAVSPEHKKKLSELSVEEALKFSSKLMYRVITVCPACNASLQPSLVDIQAITVARIVFRSELSENYKPRFIEYIYTLINAFFTIVSTFNEDFPVVPPKTKTGKEPSTIL